MLACFLLKLDRLLIGWCLVLEDLLLFEWFEFFELFLPLRPSGTSPYRGEEFLTLHFYRGEEFLTRLYRVEKCLTRPNSSPAEGRGGGTQCRRGNRCLSLPFYRGEECLTLPNTSPAEGRGGGTQCRRGNRCF